MAGRPPDESELIERARRGDAGAYGDLVHAHQGIAFRTAYLLTADAADAEDAAQAGFVKAYYALQRFRRGAPFRPWLLQIVANEARNRRRSAGRRAHLAARAHAQDSGDAAPSPEDSVLAGERRDGLLAAVNALREEDREVVALRYFLELSEEETAAVLGIPRGTVKSRTSRALDKLREKVA